MHGCAPLPARRIVACATALALLAAGIPLGAAEPSTLSGVVIEDGRSTPMAEVMVHVADPWTGEIRASDATDTEGRFVLEGLPADRYRLGVEADGGIYVVPGSVQVDEGTSGALILTVARGAGLPQPTPGIAPAASVWERPGIATLLVIGIAGATALLVDQLFSSDDNEKSSSPTDPVD
jgi:hypothetical protein